MESFLICASTGRPAQHRNVSLTHVNASFKEELQADFVVMYISDAKFEVLNMRDAGTRYGGKYITISRSAENIKLIFETEWM